MASGISARTSSRAGPVATHPACPRALITSRIFTPMDWTHHTATRAPVATKSGCRLRARWRSSFGAVHLQGFLQHRLQRNHQPFTRSFLGIHAWHLFHPADPPVAVLLHKSGVSAHARSRPRERSAALPVSTCSAAARVRRAQTPLAAETAQPLGRFMLQ